MENRHNFNGENKGTNSCRERNMDISIIFLLEITKTKNKNKKKVTTAKTCFLIEQRQIILRVTVEESPGILLKIEIVCIIQVLSEEHKCPLLAMYCWNISVTGCHLVHYKTNHAAFQRYLLLLLPKNIAADRMGQYAGGKKSIGAQIIPGHLSCPVVPWVTSPWNTACLISGVQWPQKPCLLTQAKFNFSYKTRIH